MPAPTDPACVSSLRHAIWGRRYIQTTGICLNVRAPGTSPTRRLDNPDFQPPGRPRLHWSFVLERHAGTHCRADPGSWFAALGLRPIETCVPKPCARPGHEHRQHIDQLMQTKSQQVATSCHKKLSGYGVIGSLVGPVVALK